VDEDTTVRIGSFTSPIRVVPTSPQNDDGRALRRTYLDYHIDSGLLLFPSVGVVDAARGSGLCKMPLGLGIFCRG
jgi:hypothetical protein